MVLIAGALTMLAGPARADSVNLGELVDRSTLRVCADPADLPFSNDQGAGFENKIAELVAEKLGVAVAYTWFPQTTGFVRNTLRANRCDLIMGVVAADELVQNTNPYYRSSYVLAYRTADADRFGDIDSPLMELARIGVVAGTPASDVLARKGLFSQVQPYQLVVDSRVDQPARQMIQDLADGRLDAALVWGPIAGYWAKQQQVPISLAPLKSDPRRGLRLDFRISMGIRPNEPEWKHQINDLIRELQPQIQSILLDYGVPLLDEQDRPITADGTASVAASTVAEPAGYRMDKYRTPVPATLAGVTVLSTAALQQLIAEQQPVLVDVLPKQRKPKDRDQAQLWIEPKRENLPGSVWLPNVGYGELAPDFADWFAAELGKLTGGTSPSPWCSTATPIAGCRGTPPSGRWRSWATAGSIGIPRACKAGNGLVSPW